MNQVVFPVRLIVDTRSAGNPGFTLIELMIVVVIIGVLAGIAIPKFRDVADSARAAACRSNLNSLAHCLNFYACDNNGYPFVGEPHNWRGFSLLEGYLHGADGYTCPITGSSDYRYRLYGNDGTFAVRGWSLACHNGHGHIYNGVASCSAD